MVDTAQQRRPSTGAEHVRGGRGGGAGDSGLHDLGARRESGNVVGHHRAGSDDDVGREQVLVNLDRRPGWRHAQVAQRRRAVVVLRDPNPRQHLVPNLVSDLGVGHWPMRAQRDHHENVVRNDSRSLQVVQDRR